MFYQIEVNRITHMDVRINYGDTVAMIKDRAPAIDFAKNYSGSTFGRGNDIVHVTGPNLDRYFRGGKECNWAGRPVEDK